MQLNYLLFSVPFFFLHVVCCFRLGGIETDARCTWELKQKWRDDVIQRLSGGRSHRHGKKSSAFVFEYRVPLSGFILQLALIQESLQWVWGIAALIQLEGSKSQWPQCRSDNVVISSSQTLFVSLKRYFFLLQETALYRHHTLLLSHHILLSVTFPKNSRVVVTGQKKRC